MEDVSGKIADVVNDREVILNRGSKQGVEVGMVFKVLSRYQRDIKDPDTGETLGAVERVTAVIKAVEVAANFAIARTYRTRQVNVGGSGSSFSMLFQPPKYENRIETLRVDPEQGSPLPESEAAVQVGDRVRSISEDDVPDVTTYTQWVVDAN